MAVLGKKGSCTGRGKLRTAQYTHVGTDYLLTSGRYVEWFSMKYKQLPRSCTSGRELEMAAQEVCLHWCQVSFAFIFHVDFIS